MLDTVSLCCRIVLNIPLTAGGTRVSAYGATPPPLTFFRSSLVTMRGRQSLTAPSLLSPSSLRSRLRRSRYFSTLFCNRALIHSECHQKILWLPLLSVCFNPQSAHPPTDSAADGQGSCGLPLPEGRECGKGFHRLRRRVNSSFPHEGGGLKTQRNF